MSGARPRASRIFDFDAALAEAASSWKHHRDSLLIYGSPRRLTVRSRGILETCDDFVQNCSRRGASSWLSRPPSPRIAPVASSRATIQTISADGSTLNVHTRAGEDQTIHLNPKTRFVLVVPADAYRREARVLHRRRRAAGRGKRTQGHGSAHLSRGDARDRRGLPPVRSRAEKLDDQRQHLRARRRDERAQAHRDLQGRRADHRRRSRRRRSSASSPAPRPISSPARRSSPGDPSRRTARSTPASSWSARTGSSRPCDRPQPTPANARRFARISRPVLAGVRFICGTIHS